jgi:hypothetical protein
MAEQQYQGGCHCGGLRYEVDLDLDKGSLRCNCSLCGKSRAWFAFAPAEKFTLTSGEGAEIRYRWTPPNRPEPNLTYHICSMCGVRTHAEGRDPKGNAVVAGWRSKSPRWKEPTPKSSPEGYATSTVGTTASTGSRKTRPPCEGEDLIRLRSAQQSPP